MAEPELAGEAAGEGPPVEPELPEAAAAAGPGGEEEEQGGDDGTLQAKIADVFGGSDDESEDEYDDDPEEADRGDGEPDDGEALDGPAPKKRKGAAGPAKPRLKEDKEETNLFKELGLAAADEGGSDSEDEAAAELTDAEKAKAASLTVNQMIKDKKAGKKRKKEWDAKELREKAEQFLAKMEVAFDKDCQNMDNGQPAVYKLRMLADAENILSRKLLQEDLLDAGLLGTLKLWLEPYKANLPNVKVRTTILKLLADMDLGLSDEDRKHSMKESGLGKNVNFYSKCPDETQANRRLAASLVQKWSRQIFQQYRDPHARELDEERSAPPPPRTKPAARKRAADAPDALLTKKKVLKQGDPGFRIRATVPQPLAMDFRYQPQSSAVAAPVDQDKKDKKKKFDDKMRALKKNMKKFERPINPSVEGRGM